MSDRASTSSSVPQTELSHSNPYEWIMYDSDSGYSPDWFRTEQEAIDAGNQAAQEYLDGGEWSDGAENIVVAHVTHRSTQIPLPTPEHIQEAMDDDPNYRPPHEEYCDFQMRPLAGGSTQPEAKNEASVRDPKE